MTTNSDQRLNILLSLKDEASKELRSTSAKIRAEQRKMVNAELSGDKATQKSARANIKLLKIEQSETKELAQDIKRQVREQEKSVTATKKQSSAFGGLRSNMLAIGAGIAAIGAATAGIKKLVTSVANAGDEIQKMSLRTGFSTETLSELRFAAKLSGTSIQSMETGFRKMASTVIDAEAGLTESKRAFDQLGISLSALQGIGIEQQFAIISAALADVEDQTLKVALAQDIFGRSGTQLLPMLAQGSEGLAKMRKEANDLGVVFDQEAADKAAKFNDELVRLSSAMEGVKQEIGLALIDPLTEASEATLTFIGDIRLMRRALEEDLKGLDEAGFLDRFLEGVKTGFKTGVPGLLPVIELYKVLNKHAEEVNKELEKNKLVVKSLALAYEDLSGGLAEINKENEAFIKRQKEQAEIGQAQLDAEEEQFKQFRQAQLEAATAAVKIKADQFLKETALAHESFLKQSADKVRHLEDAKKIDQKAIDEQLKRDIALFKFQADQFALSQRLFEESEREKTRIAEREFRARLELFRRHQFLTREIIGVGPAGVSRPRGNVPSLTGVLGRKTAEDIQDEADEAARFRRFNPTPQSINVNFIVDDQVIQTMKVGIERQQLDELDEV